MDIGHAWSLGEITWALLRGVAQLALELIPLVDPWPEEGAPPTWWWNGSNWFDWYMHRDGRKIPDMQFIESWLRSAWNTLGIWIEDVGKWARNEAQNLVRSWTGYVRGGWVTFSDWIDYNALRLGSGMVYWAGTAISGLDKLYNWLPPEIRTNLQSWGSLFEAIFQRARDWVVTAYQMLIAFGVLAWSWVSDSGTKLKDWWQGARGVLDEFRANPTGYILAHLGPTWDRLVWFVNNALDFYTGLWGQHAGDLAGFLADPAGWIYARLETYVERIW